MVIVTLTCALIILALAGPVFAWRAIIEMRRVNEICQQTIENAVLALKARDAQEAVEAITAKDAHALFLDQNPEAFAEDPFKDFVQPPADQPPEAIVPGGDLVIGGRSYELVDIFDLPEEDPNGD
jgi:hypothetical protein